MRYTKFNKNAGCMILPIDDKEFVFGEHIDKLSQLENIEEELGIDLIILFKALKNGIVDKIPLGQNYAYTTITPDRISIEFKDKCLRKRSEKFYFKDYGKTWALTREQLE